MRLHIEHSSSPNNFTEGPLFDFFVDAESWSALAVAISSALNRTIKYIFHDLRRNRSSDWTFARILALFLGGERLRALRCKSILNQIFFGNFTRRGPIRLAVMLKTRYHHDLIYIKRKTL